MLEAMMEPEVSEASLLNWMDQPDVLARMKERESEVAAALTALRSLDSKLSPVEKRRHELRMLFETAPFAGFARAAATDHGVSAEDFDRMRADDDVLARWGSLLPGVRVHASLVLQHQRSSAHVIKANDAKDLAFARAAIPYANIALMERSWADFARREKLGDVFQTQIEVDVARLPQLLAKIAPGLAEPGSASET